MLGRPGRMRDQHRKRPPAQIGSSRLSRLYGGHFPRRITRSSNKMTTKSASPWASSPPATLTCGHSPRESPPRDSDASRRPCTTSSPICPPASWRSPGKQTSLSPPTRKSLAQLRSIASVAQIDACAGGSSTSALSEPRGILGVWRARTQGLYSQRKSSTRRRLRRLGSRIQPCAAPLIRRARTRSPSQRLCFLT
jgi:hypothetical protein